MPDQPPLPQTPVYKAAAIQYAPTLFEKEKNLLEQLEMVEEAARNDAKLIVLVEMATTAYCFFDRAEIAPYVEPIPGPTTERVGELAARYGCYIVVGMPEVEPETDIYYNSLALVGPEGVVGKYRKTHSFISENTWAKDGDLDLPVFRTELGNLGGLICMDASFPETARVLALRGADVICFPTNWLLEKAPAPAWITRAFENGVYLVAADRWGNERTVEFSGGSAVIDPDGAIQSYRDTGNGIVYGYIDIAKARDKKFVADETGDKLLERRPADYSDSVLNSYLFNPDDYFGLYGQDGLPAGKESTIAVCQMEESLETREETFAALRQMIDGLDSPFDVLVLPELALSGPVTTESQSRALAEVLRDSESVKLLTALARDNDAFVVTSIVERDSGRMYNTALLVGPEGLVGSYRKVHLSVDDRAWASPGDGGFPVFDIPAGRDWTSSGARCHVPGGCESLRRQGRRLDMRPRRPQISPGRQPGAHRCSLRRPRSQGSRRCALAPAPLPQRGEQCIRRFRQPVRRRLHRSERSIRQARRWWAAPRGCRLGGPPGGGNAHRVYDSDP